MGTAIAVLTNIRGMDRPMRRMLYQRGSRPQRSGLERPGSYKRFGREPVLDIVPVLASAIDKEPIGLGLDFFNWKR